MSLKSFVLNAIGGGGAGKPAAAAAPQGPAPAVSVQTVPGGAADLAGGAPASGPLPTPIKTSVIPDSHGGTVFDGRNFVPADIPKTGTFEQRFAGLLGARQDRHGDWLCEIRRNPPPKLWQEVAKRARITADEVSSLRSLHERNATTQELIDSTSVSMAGHRAMLARQEIAEALRTGAELPDRPVSKEAILGESAQIRAAAREVQAEISEATYPIIRGLCDRLAKAAEDWATDLFEQGATEASEYGYKWTPTPLFMDLLFIRFGGAHMPVLHYLAGIATVRPDRVPWPGVELWPKPSDEKKAEAAEQARLDAERKQTADTERRQAKLDSETNPEAEAARKAALDAVNLSHDQLREKLAARVKPQK